MNFEMPEKFTNEDERVATMERYQSEGGSDPADIEKMMSLPVDTPDPDPVEDVEEAEATETSIEAPESKPTETPTEPAPSAPPPPPKETPQDEKQERNWTITEADIPTDEYFDRKEGRMRKFITHKDPQSLFKTVINEQKRIHYLEDILLPQEREKAAAEARADAQREIERMKAEIEAAKKQAPAPQASAQPAASAQPQDLGKTSSNLQQALQDLKAIDPKDSIEHTDKMHAALTAALEQVSALSGHISTVQQEGKQLGGKLLQFESKSQQIEQQREAEQKRSQAEQSWKSACQMIDAFAATNQEVKAEYGTIDQPFEKMTQEAVDFHIQLAGLKFDKHPGLVSNEEQMEASQSYLRGDPDITQKAAQYGINEPRNYRAWVELDQVDAMRAGLYRDPVSKKWVQMHDPISRQPVRLGDMDTAYGRYLDVTGKRAQKVNQLLKNEREGITNALGKRDTSLVSMDGSQARSDGSGAEMTEEQAIAITEQIDPQGAMAIYMRSGNKQPFEQLNAALKRLGMPELEVPELDYQTRPKVAGQ